MTLIWKSGRGLKLTAGLAVAGLALSACGESADGAAGEESVEIDFYYPIQVGGPLESVMDGYIEEFNEQNEGITVTPVYSGNYEQTLASVQSAAQAGNAPALSVLQTVHLRTLHQQEIIEPIGEIVDDQEWFSSFDEAFMVNSVLDDGTVGAVPFQRSTPVMYWNKELFEEAGLDPDTAPETWDEMVEFGQQVQDETAADWGVQIYSSDDSVWLLQAMAIQNGVVLDNAEGTQTYYDAPGVVTALENWVDLGEQGVGPGGVVDMSNTPLDFASENIGIIWATTGQLTNIADNSDFNFGVAPLPAQEQPGAPTGGGNLYVSADLPQAEQEAAVELARFLSSPEIQADWTVASGYVAPLQEAWELEPLASHVEDFPQAQIAREQLPDAERELSTYHALEVGTFGSSAVQAAMDGEGSPQEVLERAQEQADNVLDEFR